MTTIYTYFGDYLLGLFVTWVSTSGTSGGTEVDITLKANLRSKLHVYGLGSLTDGESIAFDYNSSGASGQWAAADTLDYKIGGTAAETAIVDNNNAFIGYIGTGTTNTDLVTAPSAKYPADNDQSEVYHFYLAWQNPDATGAVTYDGMEIKAYA